LTWSPDLSLMIKRGRQRGGYKEDVHVVAIQRMNNNPSARLTTS
jgi:hypothetical protein